MKRRLSLPIVGLLAVVFVGGLAMFARARTPKDEQLIATQFFELSKDLSVTGLENDLVRVVRASRLRRYFVEDVQIDLGEEATAIDGLDTLITTAAKFEIPEGGIQIAFVDLRVAVEKDRTHATVVMTIRSTRHNLADGKRDVDAREMQIALERRMDFWLIKRVSPVETLQRVSESLSGQP